MNRWISAPAAAAVFAALLAAGPARAQDFSNLGQYNRRPAISPYLNLSRGGNPAINYYGLVRPQIDTSRNLQTLQTEVQGMPSTGLPIDQMAVPGQIVPGQVVAPVTLTTGHPVTFFNHSHYFSTQGGRAGVISSAPQTNIVPAISVGNIGNFGSRR